MKSDFLNYTIEQLLDDKTFIGWVLHNENPEKWENILRDNSQLNAKVKKARQIIDFIKDKEDYLDENSILALWKKIEDFEKVSSNKIRVVKFRRRIGWAASFLLIILSGYFLFDRYNPEHQFAFKGSSKSNDAHIVLSTGEEILLKKDNSTITLNTNDQVIINDSIIGIKNNSESDDKSMVLNEISIPFGKKSELLLADGSRVWLNAGSRLAFPSKFLKNTREVYLEGEACFQVSHDNDKPFIVHASEVRVEVLGTYFNISAYKEDDIIETVLLEGSVRVREKSSSGIVKKRDILLKPNQKATYTKLEQGIIVTEEPNTENFIAWTYGWLKYNRESLLSVLTKVERYYDVTFILPDNYPLDDRITGKLDLKDSIEDVMVALSDASGFEYRIIGTKIKIEKSMEVLPR